MNILSIQSHVTCGHVGNSAAVFALQRLGHEVWPVHTVLYSNHPGHGGFRGERVAPARLAEIVEGLDDLGALADCNAVISGYLGDPETGRVVLDAVARVKARNPRAIYLCDPVMGDREGGLYVDEGLVEFFRHEAVPAADIMAPNAFELELLTGYPVGDTDAAPAALDALRALGPKTALVTGIAGEGVVGGEIAAVATDGAAAFGVATPRLDTGRRPDGAGDLFAALFLGNYLAGGNLAAALETTVSSVYAVLKATVEAGNRELRIVQSQDEMVAPPRRFAARSMR